MKKTIKKTMSMAVAMMMVVGVFVSATFAFVANENVSSRYDEVNGKIRGTVNLSKVVKSDGGEVVKKGKPYYEGTVEGRVEVRDLFEGAYDKYLTSFKGKKTLLGRAYENLVMFDKGGNFPTAKYTVRFPKNFKVNVNSIDVSANTRTISKITKTYNSADNSVTFVFNLGNWNDYREFFELYEKEKGTEGHEIKIKMPYSVEIKDQSVKNLGRISAEGKCELFYKKLFFEKKIVDISAEKIDFDITR